MPAAGVREVTAIMSPEEPVPRVLVVDDDREIRERLSRFLSAHGLVVSEAADGREMAAQLQREAVDLVVLDVMLPGSDGLTLCRQLRAQSSVPIILLTALEGESDRIVGLELGADDYVTKPFSPRELLARVRAQLRRAAMPSTAGGSPAAPSIFRFAGWSLDLARRTLVSPDGILVVLTSSEFDLLAVFAENPQRALGREQLLAFLHGRDASQFDRSIDVHVSRLRRKIEADPQRPELIKTIRNEGYFFSPRVEADGGAPA
ncbi:two-component system, OmpR family, response regulator [Tistlia consotensis]|uniref:Regulatory protein VirG n=1 Tax=Tistlia consotensis USBA 355 TaxID=560819 RepID=A0A1Y6B7K8_9PROT|nr:response regulator transcription factor [Tistlia consotensis]SME97151.1 two-component system, OmpR family, response regulator [Tistlia consotensis USBA 355]SNR56566.1 two-component system, OmpR family, response regulator [Tistlia consotensis]